MGVAVNIQKANCPEVPPYRVVGHFGLWGTACPNVPIPRFRTFRTLAPRVPLLEVQRTKNRGGTMAPKIGLFEGISYEKIPA